MTTNITEYSRTEAALAELRSKYSGVLFDVATTSGLKSAKEARAEVKGYRVDLEKLRKEIKAPALQRCKDIDDEAKRITEELLSIEKPIDEQIKQEEARKAAEKAAKEEAERQRVESIRAKIEAIRSEVVIHAGMGSTPIAAAIDHVKALEITIEEYAELAGEAMMIQAQTLEQLQAMHAKAMEHEAEQARLAAERAELERLRAEAERQAKAAREAEEARLRAEREAHEAKMRAEREELERQARAAKEAREAEMRDFLAQKEEFERRQAEASKPVQVAESTATTSTTTKTRPTDQEIIEVLANHFRAYEGVVIGWLCDMDLEAASQQLAEAI